jgi:hypothetical protein
VDYYLCSKTMEVMMISCHKFLEWLNTQQLLPMDCILWFRI